MRIGLFATCVVDLFFPDVGLATATVLERLGHTVELPPGQTCCGQLHANTGYPDAARQLARRFVDVFAGFDAVVAPSGSCVAEVRHHYPRLVEGDAELGRGVGAVGRRTYELSEFLVDVLGVADVGARYPHRVAFHPSCHAARVLRVADRPRVLLRAVRDLELVDIPDEDTCCGFGGTFAIKNADVSAAILADKIDALGSTGASRCAGADMSCLMHIGGGLSRRGEQLQTVHLAEILAAR